MNDVILNRRVTILDKEALLDAKRSLTVMLGDFLRQHKVRIGREIAPATVLARAAIAAALLPGKMHTGFVKTTVMST